jgi:hypothetical protein
LEVPVLEEKWPLERLLLWIIAEAFGDAEMSQLELFDVTGIEPVLSTRGSRPAHLLVMLGAALAALLVPSMARAIPLDSLEGTTSTIGPLTIEWTRVEQTGGLDLGALDLMLASDGHGAGFDIVSPTDALSVGSGGLADLKLEFRVTSTQPIVFVRNELNASVAGDLSGASVFETISEAPSLTVLAFVMESMAQNPTQEALGSALLQLTIVKNVILTAGDSAGGSGDFVRIDGLQQRFGVVPEPGTALLLMMGLAGMGAMGSGRLDARRTAPKKELAR